jgi:hypothetical protein
VIVDALIERLRKKKELFAQDLERLQRNEKQEPLQIPASFRFHQKLLMIHKLKDFGPRFKARRLQSVLAEVERFLQQPVSPVEKGALEAAKGNLQLLLKCAEDSQFAWSEMIHIQRCFRKTGSKCTRGSAA